MTSLVNAALSYGSAGQSAGGGGPGGSSSWSSLLGPILGYGSFAWEKAASVKANKKAFKRNLWLASTAYQRAVQDLKAAGLNPMLAYTQGGAPSPTVAQASIPDLDLSRDLESGISSAKHMQAMRDELGRIRAERKTAESESIAARNAADASKYATQEAYYRAGLAGAEWLDKEESAISRRWERALMEQQTRSWSARADIEEYGRSGARAEARWYDEEHGEFLKGVEKLSRALGPIAPLFRGRR